MTDNQRLLAILRVLKATHDTSRTKTITLEGLADYFDRPMIEMKDDLARLEIDSCVRHFADLGGHVSYMITHEGRRRAIVANR